MPNVTATVKVDLAPLGLYQATVNDELKGRKNGHVAKAIKQWVAIYRSFAQERYDRASKGDGTWPPLKPGTIRARRKGKGSSKFKKGSVAILKNLGILFAALSPTFTKKPGALEEDIPFGVRVGYGGPHGYPDAGAVTIADIASFHQVGAGWLPKREIIVQPNAAATTIMARVMDAALHKVVQDKKAGK